jgi:predicted RND superfamily exporter protein
LNGVVSVTLTPVGTIAVLVATLGILAGAIAGLPSLKTDFDIKWFTPDDSSYKATYDFQDRYFPTAGGVPVYIFTKSGDYSVAHSDGSLAALYQRTSTCEWIDRSVGNWYTEFVADAGRSARSQASESAFASEVSAFVSSTAGARFANDLSFETDGSGSVSGIRASRAMYLAKETQSGEEDIAMTKSVRSCVDGRPLAAFAFNKPFLYFDGLDVVASETIQNILIACGCVFLVNVVMLADLFAAFLVLLMVGLVDVCILGYMAHWDLDFNSVTAINLVLAVGLAVDYSAHIAHSFLVSKGCGVDRAKEAVDHIGASVFSGAFSTFVAVLPLGLSKSYVFRVFFKMWFMIILSAFILV